MRSFTITHTYLYMQEIAGQTMSPTGKAWSKECPDGFISGESA